MPESAVRQARKVSHPTSHKGRCFSEKGRVGSEKGRSGYKKGRRRSEAGARVRKECARVRKADAPLHKECPPVGQGIPPVGQAPGSAEFIPPRQPGSCGRCGMNPAVPDLHSCPLVKFVVGI